MTTYVRTLYDFSGEPNTSELTILAGEVLTVSRTDVGEGWWEGTNSKGQTGLFPAAYVEYFSPVAQQQQQSTTSNSSSSGTSAIPVASPTIGGPVVAAAAAARYDQTSEEWNEGPDDWEDDWDEDNEYSEIGPGQSGNNVNNNITQVNSFQKHGNVQQQIVKQQHQPNNYSNLNLPPTPADDAISISSSAHSSTATVKKSGMFSKSGDSYILGTVNVPVPDGEKMHIIQKENFYYWQSLPQHYTVRVASPKKETKFKGMKSFIAYQLTPSFNGIAVSRRYKHFDWLHERLVDKFSLIPIPPLPDKQISGRYEDEFIEHRRVQLQEFMDWVCRHPVVSSCEVWMHFLTCTDDKKWKIGKRAAEKDSLVGFSYCAAILPPVKQLLPSYVDDQIDSCSSFSHAMDTAVKSLLAMSFEQTKRNQIQSRKDFQRTGEGFAELAKALEIDERRYTTQETLSKSIGYTSGLFITIGRLFGEQPKNDWIPFSDRLHIYRGILGSFPDILASHKSAMQKRKDCERLTADQKMGNIQLNEVNRRTDIISYAVLAEMSHFRAERDIHLKKTMKHFINAQIEFYTNIIGKLQEAKSQFN